MLNLKTDGRSAVQPRLIRKQAEWRYPGLTEPFLSTEELFKAEPRSWEDKKAAIQNQTLLNYQFNIKINKVRFIDNYVHAAVNEGTVICRVGWITNHIRKLKEFLCIPTMQFRFQNKHKHCNKQCR